MGKIGLSIFDYFPYQLKHEYLKMAELKIMPLEHHKKTLISLQEFGLGYPDAKKPLFENLSFEIAQGERVFLNGSNGCRLKSCCFRTG